MAKITQLPEATALEGIEHLPILQRGITRRVTLGALIAGILPFLHNWYKGDKGDPGGTSTSIGLFGQASSLLIPVGTDLVQTSGNAAIGVGRAHYCADPAVDAAFVAAHPRFAFISANKRGFRLCEERITPEMCGARDSYDPAYNDQPAIQAAQDACELFNAVGVGRRRYALWNTTRTVDSITAPGGNWLTFGVGGFRWEAENGRFEFSLFSRTGGDPSNDIQMGHRGHGITCLAPWPQVVGPIVVRGMILDGQQAGCGRVSNPNLWDTTNQGLNLLDRNWKFAKFEDCEIRNFRGELMIYNAYGPGGRAYFYHTRCHYHSTTANAFNPGSLAGTFVSDCRFGNAYSSECTFGFGSRLTNTQFYNTQTIYMVGGPYPDFPKFYGYARRSVDEAPPWVDLSGVTFDDVDNCRLGNWLRGKVSGTDCNFSFADTGWPTGVQLEIDSTLDRRATDDDVALEIYGPPNLKTEYGKGMPAGTFEKPPADCRVVLRLHQSDFAKANGRMWHKAFRYGGLIDPSVQVILSGPTRDYPGPAGEAIAMPMIVDAGMRTRRDYGDGINAPYFFMQPGERTLQINGPVMTLDAPAGASVSLSLLTAFPTIDGLTPIYAEGQEVVLVCAENDRTFTLPAADMARHSLDADVVLAGQHRFVRLRYTRANRWALVDKGRLF